MPVQRSLPESTRGQALGADVSSKDLTCWNGKFKEEQPQYVLLCQRRKRTKYSLARPLALVEALQCHWR